MNVTRDRLKSYDEQMNKMHDAYAILYKNVDLLEGMRDRAQARMLINSLAKTLEELDLILDPR